MTPEYRMYTLKRQARDHFLRKAGAHLRGPSVLLDGGKPNDLDMDGREAGGEWSIKNQFSAMAATESNAKLHATLQKFDAKPTNKADVDHHKPVYDPIASGRKVSRFVCL